jgi:nuclear transport factor 2 (NTF2) superfamily protein
MSSAAENPRPPVPPFDREAAMKKVRMAEDAWNGRDPHKVALAYTPQSVWRNRAEFFTGREAIVQFLTRKWARELDYRLIKELWAFHENRIAVRFAYEWHDDSGSWFRSYESRVSTICRSASPNASISGRSDGGPTIIPASRT